MQYGMTPRLVWHILEKDLRAELTRRYGQEDASAIMKDAQIRFREIVGGIEDPRQGRRYFWSLLQAGLLASVYIAARAQDPDVATTPEECAGLFADVYARSSACLKIAAKLRGDFSIQSARHPEKRPAHADAVRRLWLALCLYHGIRQRLHGDVPELRHLEALP